MSLVARLRATLSLLVGRRLAAVLVADALLLGVAGLEALILHDQADVYLFVVLPGLLLGLPILSDVVALERRAGMLEIALASPGASFHFERRAGAFAALLAAQGILVLVLARLFVARFPLLPPVLQTLVVAFLFAEAALLWGALARSAGAVLLGTLATLAPLAPWILATPVHPQAAGRFLPLADDALVFLRANLVLGLAGLVLALYARRRLTDPETLLR